MNASEILAELPHLDARGRAEIFDRLCQLQEADLLQGSGPTAREKKLLDEALAGFEKEGELQTPWRGLITELIEKRRR